MQHDSKRSSTVQNVQFATAPIELSDELLALIGGGVTEITEPPEPINVVASDAADGPRGGW